MSTKYALTAVLAVLGMFAAALAAPGLASAAPNVDPPPWNLFINPAGHYVCDRGVGQGLTFVSGPYETQEACEAAIPSGDGDGDGEVCTPEQLEAGYTEVNGECVPPGGDGDGDGEVCTQEQLDAGYTEVDGVCQPPGGGGSVGSAVVQLFRCNAVGADWNYADGIGLVMYTGVCETMHGTNTHPGSDNVQTLWNSDLFNLGWTWYDGRIVRTALVNLPPASDPGTWVMTLLGVGGGETVGLYIN